MEQVVGGGNTDAEQKGTSAFVFNNISSVAGKFARAKQEWV